MKEDIEQLLLQSVSALQADGTLPEDIAPKIMVTRTKDPSHGDFACNIAMMLAKPAGMNPRELAGKIVAALPANNAIDKTDIAGPGFINFFLTADSTSSIIPQILEMGERFGHSDIGKGEKIQLEFVSANPTGPIHVGHGRGAAYGATVASLMRASGYEVDCEYYVNDAGRQMHILATSIWIRYLQENGLELPFPSNGYKSEDYIYDIALELKAAHRDSLVHDTDALMSDIPADEPDGGDKEEHIDALIDRARALLGDDGYRTVFDAGLESILGGICEDLADFGVEFQTWYSEQSLADRGLIDKAVAQLTDAGYTYEKEGALWFRSTDFGDEKDRVIIRDNGQGTYFASDIAYHLDKFDRGYDRAINIWGADHHGYIPRVKAALKALGRDEDKLDILMVQFAILYRGGEMVQMSTRSGSFVTLSELREEIGNDAARFFYVMRKCEQHMDFDLDLAKSQSNENPVYYIQYAHARVCSVLGQLGDKGYEYDAALGNQHLDLLTEKHETDLITAITAFPETIARAATQAEPHSVVHYLRDLANQFHTYYNAHQFIVEDAALRNARLNLISAVRTVINNGLHLLGVSAPESM